MDWSNRVALGHALCVDQGHSGHITLSTSHDAPRCGHKGLEGELRVMMGESHRTTSVPLFTQCGWVVLMVCVCVCGQDKPSVTVDRSGISCSARCGALSL